MLRYDNDVQVFWDMIWWVLMPTAVGI
jgi:hypothetical protein